MLSKKVQKIQILFLEANSIFLGKVQKAVSDRIIHRLGGYDIQICINLNLQCSIAKMYDLLQLKFNIEMEPQPCTKCNALPEDILMLACSHDLCLNCASDRLAFEMKKKTPATVPPYLNKSIVCEFCYERTPLDAESVAELEKLIQPSRNVSKNYETRQPESKVDRPAARPRDASYERQKEKPYEKSTTREYGLASDVKPTNTLISINSKKQCIEHPEEDILYFCFDCKCECICPECVIHGKHKDHEVKTIKKAHPTVRAEIEGNLERIENAIETLLIRKSEAEKNIRSLTEQNSTSKRQIQQAFEEVRNKLDIQEKQILARCDTVLENTLSELEKTIKTIMKKIEELRSHSAQNSEFIKKDQLVMLNYYSRRWKELKEEASDGGINVPSVTLPNNEKTLATILDLTDAVDRISIQRH